MTSAGYPLYAAAFFDRTTLVVGGGGGEGRHGIKNKLTSINASTGEVQQEYELPAGEDNPTCLAAAGQRIYVGANRGAKAIEERKNLHLRVFDKNLQEQTAVDALKFTDPAAYQKAIAASEQIVAAVSDCAGGGALQVLASGSLDSLWSQTGDFLDVAISPDNALVAVVDSASLVVYNAVTGKQIAKQASPKGGAKWVRVTFTSNLELIAGANIPNQRARIQQLRIQDDVIKVIRSRSVPGKSLTCLKSTPHAVAVGTAAGDVYLYTSALKSLRNLRGTLKFPVTSLAIIEDGEIATVAATSLDGSYSISDVSLNTFSTTIWWVLLSTIAIAFIAFISGRLISMDLQYLSFRTLEPAVAPSKYPGDAANADAMSDFEALFVDTNQGDNIS